MSNSVFGKSKENVRQDRYQACKNRKKKKLFGIRTKLPYNKMVFKKHTWNRNEKRQRY